MATILRRVVYSGRTVGRSKEQIEKGAGNSRVEGYADAINALSVFRRGKRWALLIHLETSLFTEIKGGSHEDQKG
jgi:hypothetical protein